MRFVKGAASRAVLAFVCAGAAPAMAQTEAPEVEAVIVTAQKREQNLQDVPIVVNVVSGQQLQDAGVRDVKDLQVLTPGLSVTSSSGGAQTSIRIRGIGTIGDNAGLESSVGTVVDGVYRARSGVAFGDLGELERIEVLKGPQGTVFGKNTSAGVINVITKAPEFQFGGEGELLVGNHDQRAIAAGVTGPLSETVAARLYVAKRDRDGFYNVRNGAGPNSRKDNDDQDVFTIRGQALWEASEALTLRFMADYTERDEHCCLAVSTLLGPTTRLIDAVAADEGIAQPADPSQRLAYANRESAQKLKDKGVSLQADWELGDDLTLTSITAWRDWSNVQGNDIDFSSADLWSRPFDGQTFQKFEVFSQETRLAGRTGPLDWMVGAYYSDEQLDAKNFTPYGTAYETYFGLLLSGGTNPNAVSALTGLPAGTNFPAGQGPLDTYDHSNRGWALFTNNTWRITEDLEFTFGLRYSDDTKKVFSQYRNTVPGAACAAAIVRPIPAAARSALCAPGSDPAFNNVDTRQKLNEDRWGGTAKLSYRWSRELMTYVSFASSHKSGGFNLDRARLAPGVINTDTSFPAETVESWEIGAKSNLFENRLTLNAALFDQTFEDFQLNTFTGISFVVASVPKVTSKGVDLDMVWRTPIPGLTATGGVTYAVTQYGTFVPTPGVGARLPGSRMSYAPLWSASWSGAYERDLGSDLRLRASLSGRYTSAYNTGSNLDPNKVQEELTIWNGRIGVGSADELWTVELFAQNLTDEDYYQVVVDQPLQSGTFSAFMGAPRTWGVTLRSRF
jgi:outer membrane receptor protein involved in Fe transport